MKADSQLQDCPRERVVYFDVLNILAAFNVVWIHFGNDVYIFADNINFRWCVFIQTIAFWAVPVFLMLSGATLLTYRKRYSTKVFFLRRITRLFIPYLFWGMVMLLLAIRRGELAWPDGSIGYKIAWIVNVFVNNSMENILWFIPMIIGIYLSMPLLSLLSEEKNRPILRYCLVAGVLLTSVIPITLDMLREYLGMPIYWNSSWEAQAVKGYLVYPLLGYWAATHSFTVRQRLFVYASAIACSLLRYYGIIELSIRDQATNRLFINYLGFPGLFLALGVFVFIRYLFTEHIHCTSRVSKLLKESSACSLGIYFTHYIVMREMISNPIFGYSTFQWYFLWPLLCYLFCLGVVYLLRKTPVRHVFP